MKAGVMKTKSNCDIEDEFLASYYETKKSKLIILLLGCKTKESRNTEAKTLVQYCKKQRKQQNTKAELEK